LSLTMVLFTAVVGRAMHLRIAHIVYLETACMEPPATREVLEEIEPSRAIFSLYEGALFHHQGAGYLVREVRFTERIALVERRAIPYFTRPHDFTDVEIVRRRQFKPVSTRTSALYGDLLIRVVVFGYDHGRRRPAAILARQTLTRTVA